eukprot:jgi/Mesvir1/5286/Mv15391-RA.1
MSATGAKEQVRTCLRCRKEYAVSSNGPDSCQFHGHFQNDRGYYVLAPPHMGIDGDWTDETPDGRIVYVHNPRDQRPNTGRHNWGKRWSCCHEKAEDAPGCHRGPHISYEDNIVW